MDRFTEAHAPEASSHTKTKQCIDTGMAMILICIIGAIAYPNKAWLITALILSLVNMTVPILFIPAAKLWFGVSTLIGTLMSKIFLCVIFYFVVTPIAYVMRIKGHDPMQLTAWKNDTTSVFMDRNHQYTSEDIDNPF